MNWPALWKAIGLALLIVVIFIAELLLLSHLSGRTGFLVFMGIFLCWFVFATYKMLAPLERWKREDKSK